jgi:hypothetical protein
MSMSLRPTNKPNPDQSILRASATKYVLEKTDRILNRNDVRVEIRDSQSVPAPAFTNGELITINSNYEPLKSSLSTGFSTKSMLLVTALNYHELAHCMFMPRLDTKLVKDIQHAGAFFSFNILQDQIDETRFVQLYEPAKNYFTAVVAYYMMKDESYLRSNYVLVSGRLFIPKRLREKFKENFDRPEIIPDLDALIAEYKTLSYPDDQQRMYEIVIDLDKLLGGIQNLSTSPAVLTPHDMIKQGSPDQERSRQLAEEDEEDYEPEEETTDQGAAGEQEEPEESADDQGASGSEDEDGDDDSASSDAGSDDSGTGASEPDIEDTLADVFDQALKEVEQEVSDRIDSVKDHEADYRVEEASQNFNTSRPPTPQLTNTVDRCVEAFRLENEKNHPGWMTSQRQGKLNPRDYAKALRGSEYIFRRWKEGVHDSMEFEVVFLLDCSSSMEGVLIEQASDSLWVLKRTFEELEGTVTVLGFSNTTWLLSQRGDPALRNSVSRYRAYGGTHVSSALKEARRILSVSDKALKLCVVITDGRFSDHSAAQSVVRDIESPISMIGIQSDVSVWDQEPNVIHTEQIMSATELVEVVQSLALRLSQERMSTKGH